MDISKDLIGNWAALNANVFLFYPLDKTRVHLQVETMPNALRAEQYGIEKFSVCPHVGLARVEIELHSVADFHLCFHDL